VSEFFKKRKLHEPLWRVPNEREKLYDYFLIIWTWKIHMEEVPKEIPWRHFSHLRKRFSKLILHKILVMILPNIIGSYDFLLSFSQSKSRIKMCNLHWCYTFCTCVTLELHCSQPIRIEYGNFFMNILLRWLITVSSTFQEVDFDGSLLPLFITWCYNHGIKTLHNHRW